MAEDLARLLLFPIGASLNAAARIADGGDRRRAPSSTGPIDAGPRDRRGA